MQKIRIICLNSDKKKVVAALHRMGMLDLRKSSLSLENDSPEGSVSTLSDSILSIEGAMNVLEKQKVTREKHGSVEEVLARADACRKTTEKIYSLLNRKKQVEEDNTLSNYALRVAELFKKINIDFSKLRGETLGFKAFVGDERQVAVVESNIRKMKVEHEFITENAGKKEKLIFIAYEKNRNIDEAFKNVKLEEIDLHATYIEGKPLNIIEKMSDARERNKKILEGIANELKEISVKEYSKLANTKEMLEIENSREEALQMFKKTGKAVVIEGWIPIKKEAELSRVVGHASEGRYAIEKLSGKDELAPTYLNRPKIFKPFDFLMNFYSTPRSDEIDPTWIFIISFPIFYGLMLSDVGYGLLSLAFVTYVAKITNPEGLVHNTAKIWQLTSISAIIFGVLSNQYLGVGLNQYFIPWFHGFNWFSNVTSLIVITILFGIVQVCLGLMLGFFNNMKHGHRKHALAKLFSIGVVILGTVAIAGAFFGLFAANITIIAAVGAVLLIVSIVASNPGEATEITSLVTHPLSYSRIMGFGLASVIIGFLIDKAFMPSLSQGPFIVLYIIIFLVLHFLNMILGIFEGAVQAVRLNFIEFYTKFYTGSGIKFNPFAYRRVNTEE
jgi:V/A-type H+-transporting ATPase subunit I